MGPLPKVLSPPPIGQHPASVVTQVTANPTQTTMAASVLSSKVHHQLFMPSGGRRVGPGQAGQEIPPPAEMQGGGDGGGGGGRGKSGRGSRGWVRPPAVFVQRHSSGTKDNN